MPVTGRYAYYDHAAVAPLPEPAAAAVSDYARQACEHGDTVWMSWSAAIADLRHEAASLIGASVDEVALVNNTTQGINLVAEGFPWKPGDNVLVPNNEFPSNLLPWRNLARLGVEVRAIPVPPGGEIRPGHLEPLFDARTRLVAISWVGFLSGFRVDVAPLVEQAHARGCLLSLDAIQGLGAFPIDVRQCGVDFLCADGHKWMLGPEGAGLFYVRQEHLNLLQPLGLGWNSLAKDGFDPGSMDIKSTAARYEGGSMNMPGMHGFGASLKLLNSHGAGRSDSPLAAAILNNVDELQELLTAAGMVCHLPHSPRHRSGIFGISWPEADRGGAATYLQARKFCLDRDVVLSVRGGRLRASPHAYNNSEDHQRLVEALVAFRNQ